MKKWIAITALLACTGCGSLQIENIDYEDLTKSMICINGGIRCGKLAENLFASTEGDFIDNWKAFNACVYGLHENGCAQQADKFRKIIDEAMENNE